MTIHHLLLAPVAGLASLVLAACLGGCASSPSANSSNTFPSASSPEVPADPKILRVGVTPTMPPMIFKRGGEYAGLEADFAREFAADIGRTVRFVELPWDNQTDALLADRIDVIMSNMTLTRARTIRVDFAKPYMRSGQSALVRRSELATIQMGLLTSGFRVGVMEATTGDYLVQQQMPAAKRVPVASPSEGAQAVIRDDVVMFIHDAPVNWWLASKYETKGLTLLPTLMTEEYLGWAFRKDSIELRESANLFLAKAEKSGQLQKTIQRWIPQWNMSR